MKHFIRFIFGFPQWARVFLSLGYLLIVALLSLLPPQDLPDVPLFPGFDKLVHCCMYFGLAIVASWSMHAEEKSKWYFVIAILSIGWGVLMEVSQFEMHMGRSFDLFDMLANSVGTLLGLSLYISFAHLKKAYNF